MHAATTNSSAAAKRCGSKAAPCTGCSPHPLPTQPPPARAPAHLSRPRERLGGSLKSQVAHSSRRLRHSSAQRRHTPAQARSWVQSSSASTRTSKSSLKSPNPVGPGRRRHTQPSSDCRMRIIVCLPAAAVARGNEGRRLEGAAPAVRAGGGSGGGGGDSGSRQKLSGGHGCGPQRACKPQEPPQEPPQATSSEHKQARLQHAYGCRDQFHSVLARCRA